MTSSPNWKARKTHQAQAVEPRGCGQSWAEFRNEVDVTHECEATVVRNYIDWILSLPWFEKTKDKDRFDESARI